VQTLVASSICSHREQMQTIPLISARWAVLLLVMMRFRESNNLDATVQRTVACRQLDGCNSSIFAYGKNANDSPHLMLLINPM